MHFTRSLRALAIVGSTFVAAAPPVRYESLDKREEDYDDLIDPCKGMPDKEDEGYIYRLGLRWTQYGSIGGGGEPTIEDSGGVITYDNDCNIIDEADWNGGAGRLPDWLSVETDEPDLQVSLNMGNPLLSGEGSSQIPTPTDLKFKNDEGDLDHRKPEATCQPGWNRGSYPVTYYRMCHFNSGL